ncbi:MAG: methyltransferase domain-containing protein [Verrucomicrobiaceae bacterium]
MNLDKYRNSEGKLWLNVASGNYFLDHFVHLDSNFLIGLSRIYPLIKTLLRPAGREWLRVYREGLAKGHRFIYANCSKPLKFPENSVDHILASHFLEHNYPDVLDGVLKGFFRALKPGGTLHIIVPDMEIRARRYLEKCGTPEAVNEFVESLTFRYPKCPHWVIRWMQAIRLGQPEHCWMYDQYSMPALLRQHGFIIAAKNDSPSAQWRLTEWGQVNLLVRKP